MKGDKCIYCNGILEFNSITQAHLDCEEDFLYHQRLDKVLAKCVIVGGGKWIYEMMDAVNIVYNSFKFYFQTKHEVSHEISLDTVEHILQDMEAQDE